jgi:transcriptional regulator with XRE-family HTH domain
MLEKFPTFPQKSQEKCFNLTTKGQDLNRFTMLGQKLRELREAKGLVQRQVAAELEVDTAYVSKMESNEKPVSRAHLKKLSELLGIDEEELLTLWLADKVYDMVKDENVALKALSVTEEELKINPKRKKARK